MSTVSARSIYSTADLLDRRVNRPASKSVRTQRTSLWSLELAFEVFHKILAYDLGGEDLDTALITRAKFQKE